MYNHLNYVSTLSKKFIDITMHVINVLTMCGTYRSGVCVVQRLVSGACRDLLVTVCRGHGSSAI